MIAGAEAGAVAAEDGISVFSDEDAWDVLEDIPNDSAAALILLEHHWAVPLRDAVVRAGGFRIADGVHQPTRPRRDRPAHGRGSEAAPRRRDRRGQNRELRRHHMFGSRRVARRTGRRTARRVSRR